MIYNKLVVATVFLTTVLLFNACSSGVQQSQSGLDYEKLPTVSGTKIVATYTNNGVLRSKLTSGSYNQFPTADPPYTEFPGGMYVIFYKDKGEEESCLRANYAKYYEDKKLWEAQGNVEIVNPKGDKLSTDLMFADETLKKMYSTQFVKINMKDGSSISGGGGFYSNFNFTEYEFRDVSGIVNTTKSGQKEP